MTGFLLELRRGPGLWATPVLVIAGMFNAFVNLQTSAVWTYATGAVANALIGISPVAALAAVVAGGRGHQGGITDRERLSPWGVVRAATAEIGALIAWTMVASVLVAAVLFGITATKTTSGGPVWPWLIASAVGLAAHVVIGWVVGRLIPWWYDAMFAAAVIVVVTGAATNGLFYREWLSQPFLIPIRLQSPFDDVHAAPLLGQILWFVGLSAAAVSVFALVTRAPWRSVALLGTAAVVVLGSGTAVAAWSRPQLDDPARHVTWECVGEAPEVCVHPAYAASIPELRMRAEAVAARLAGTPFAIRRVEQRPRSLSGGAPSPGAVAFGFDAPLPRQYDRAASEMASGALGITGACSRPDGLSHPGWESLTMISTWAAGGTDVFVGPEQQAAWSWLTSQPVAQIQVWITAHAPVIRDCTLSLPEFR